MREYLPEIITIIFMFTLVGVVLALLTSWSAKAEVRHDNKLWNDGHCDICGGAWEYEQAVGHKYDTSYIYVCDDCSKRIELYEMR